MKNLQKIVQDKNLNYNLYLSNFIVKNQNKLIFDANEGLKCFEHFFNHSQYTWTYHYYNIFSLTSGSRVYYELFNILNFVVRDYTKTEEPLWIQSWINSHSPSEVLDWHNHGAATCHGYISINPHKTVTRFSEYEINNKVGQIYIGESHRDHAVIVEELFDHPRLTIGYDIYNEQSMNEAKIKYGYDKNLGFIPI